MQASTLTPTMIFGHHVRYVVPLFQRPYVWNELDQWAPLWADVQAIADQVLAQPGGYVSAATTGHFLGAIVLEQPLVQTGYIAVRHVIDGQQRLTTLQVMLDAARRVAERHGSPMDAQALRILVLNEQAISQKSHEVYKVWPTDRDQDAFDAAMDRQKPVPAELASSAVARAHAYFSRVIEGWAVDPGDADQTSARIEAITRTLREHLKIVVIDLEPGDNAQVIFETLNHRGAPLLAADLIKNLIFQTAVVRELDAADLYRRHWRELDNDYWRQKVARGRQYVPRIDIFVNYWLILRLQREVPADRIFVDFRDQIVKPATDIEALLAELVHDARIYASLESLPADSPVAQFHYRVVQAMDSAVVTPLLLWLLRWPETALSHQQRDKALAAVESWLIRRALCRLTSRDINRLMLELLQAVSRSGAAIAGDVIEEVLLKQKADSRHWPSDEMVRESLGATPVYRALLRGRLRMLLEAIEDHRRTSKSEQACPRGLTIEHVMPQAWREHWIDDLAGSGDAVERDHLLHTLGNLTLVNKKLNPALSNRPWSDQTAQQRGLGKTGKRTELLRHSTLKINADLVQAASGAWNDAAVRARTAVLADAVVQIWSRPDGPAAPLTLAEAERDPLPAPSSSEADDYAGTTSGKYGPLTDWLRAQTADLLPMTFEDIEEILGQPLPPSARNHPPYWYSAANSLGKAIVAGGYKPTGANLTTERVTLVRLTA